ncbi:MAG: aldehyde ferredoxin oxidoreductase N-terminal domain-containing protein [Thermosphaera aggregans]|uniref:aldehyde ferredoxin oxidoreductase N-terminal domain-containing protein n=1 Tax=Thermosphaera aggregans TaxID=54254 RepID=UPI003C065D84
MKDGCAEIRDATHPWGLTTKETVEEVKKELGSPSRGLVASSLRGKLVRLANIVFKHRYAAGRGGMGAVMGSRNLKL